MIKQLLCYGVISFGMITWATAQIIIDPFHPGYVVRNGGDTLQGFLKPGDQVIKFKSLNNSRLQKLPYDSLTAYTLDYEGIQYQKLSDGFYELVLDGPVRLYKKTVLRSVYNEKRSTAHEMVHYVVVRDISEPVTKLRVLGSYDRGRKYFRRTAAEYFKDCPEIVADITSGMYNKVETISDLVTRYNDWLLAVSSKR